jgi:hypothetical protein
MMCPRGARIASPHGITSTEVAGELVTALSAQMSGRDLRPLTPWGRALVEQCRDAVAEGKEG